VCGEEVKRGTTKRKGGRIKREGRREKRIND